MKKITKQYYFTVEGETEEWYLRWLEGIINNESSSQVKVSFKISTNNPESFGKKINNISNIEIIHVIDYESKSEEHTKKFENNLGKLKNATNLGKDVKYKLAYCNFTFDSWIILHQINCFGCLNDRKDYLKYINQAYSEKFDKMETYKKEKNFNRLLNSLTLNNVKYAYERAKFLMKNKQENGLKPRKFKGFEFYEDNPSLNLWLYIKKILNDCGL